MNIGSKEFYCNMKEKDIPYWNPLYSYDEQDDDVKQFWDNEAKKLTNGVTINGVFIHPWLYWHLNFWKMMLDVGEGDQMQRVPGLSELRDNEWFFAEMLQEAEEKNMGIFMFGTRRFGKALLNSEIVYMKDRECSIGDLQVGDKIFGDDGKITEVTGVYPQGKVTTYKITFEDGRNAICCGEHLWKVRYRGSWRVETMKKIMSSDWQNMEIPLCKGLEYKNERVPLPPSMFGSMMADYLSGGPMPELALERSVQKAMLRSCLLNKKNFIESFIKYFKGVVTGDETLPVLRRDLIAIRFVLRVFWCYGWYASYDGNSIYVSELRDSVGIKGIEVYGKYEATCITVDNRSKMFVTTNYLVTHNTAIMSSLLARNATMTYNLSHNVFGGSKEDLMNLGEYLEFGLDNLPPFLKINRTGNDWFKEVVLGVKNLKNERDVHARIRISNLDSGMKTASLKPAGNTPFTSIYDEVGKFPFLDAYMAGLPAHMMKGRMRGMILAAGCVEAGTEVYTADGTKVYIEDLRQEDGIMGFSTTTLIQKPQNIEWMKPPADKPCVRVTALYYGRETHIDCSYDHPFYCKEPKGRDSVYYDYVQAARLLPGDLVGYVRNGKFSWVIIKHVRFRGIKKVYNVMAGVHHNYIANGFITHNTGGNVERSKDAQKVMNNPEQYNFILMDYDILNKHVKTPTWTKRKSGVFVPGQMSHAFEKDQTTLDRYLDIKNANMLRRINIQVTNFERSTAAIKEKLEELAKGDKELYVQQKMAYPLTVDDCFLNSNINRFPIEDAMIKKSRILEEGRPGKTVDIYQIDNNKIGYNFSEKQLAPYPFKGGNIDSPVVIYEDPPEDGGVFDYTYVSGNDPYKSEKSFTESLGAFYVLKRHVQINDPFAYKIVASYVSRPPSSDEFCRNCEILQEAYGAMCLMENADRMYEVYLARRNKEMVLLEDGEKLADRIIKPGARQNNRLGLSPTPANQRMLFNAVLQYCWEPVVVGYNEDGTEITQKGIYRIDDIELLEEIIAFGPGVNTDRIIAFGHALLLARYYDDLNYMPKSRTEKINEEYRKMKTYSYRGMSVIRHNPFPQKRIGFTNFANKNKF